MDNWLTYDLSFSLLPIVFVKGNYEKVELRNIHLKQIFVGLLEILLYLV